MFVGVGCIFGGHHGIKESLRQFLKSRNLDWSFICLFTVRLHFAYLRPKWVGPIAHQFNANDGQLKYLFIHTRSRITATWLARQSCAGWPFNITSPRSHRMWVRTPKAEVRWSVIKLASQMQSD